MELLDRVVRRVIILKPREKLFRSKSRKVKLSSRGIWEKRESINDDLWLDKDNVDGASIVGCRCRELKN